MGETLRRKPTPRRPQRLPARLLAALVTIAATTAAVNDTDPPPDRAVEIYRWAAEDAACDLDWETLAALADVGSDHARVGGAEIARNGDVRPPIVGPPLDGRNGRRSVADTDGGALDGDPELDRAVGPFQFLPTTWAAVATDGNGDGLADPHNFWDAAAGAATLLCDGGTAPASTTALWYGTDAFDGVVAEATVAATATSVQRVRGLPHGFGLLVSGVAADDADGPAERVVPLELSGADDPASDAAATAGVTDVASTSGAGAGLVGGRLDQILTMPRLDGTSVLVGDWDGDGIDEPRPAGDLLPAAVLGDDTADLRAVVGDWDGDGDDDAGLFAEGVVHLYRDDEVHRIAPDLADEPTAAIVLAGDWSGTGADDLVVAVPDGDRLLLTFLRTGFGVGVAGEHYGRSFSIPTGDQLLAGDLDGDGIDTVLSVWRGAGDLVVVAHHRDGVTTEQRSVSLADLPTSLAAGDQPLGLVTGTWPAPADDEPRSFAVDGLAGTLPEPEFWLEATSADGSVVELWWVGHEDHRIAVAVDRVVQTQAMIAAAAADGVLLKGWGWRSFERQIELRAAHCADIWTTPAAECSPPTARPGHSRHEYGLAVDFSDGTAAIGPDSPEFAWLAEHAADFGYVNLPSESWHWSADGH